MRPLPDRAGEQVERLAAPLAAVVDDRGAGAMAVDDVASAGAAVGTAKAVGVEEVEKFLVAGRFIHQFDDREVHEVGSVRGEHQQIRSS